jgi:hypothetical protein
VAVARAGLRDIDRVLAAMTTRTPTAAIDEVSTLLEAAVTE